VAVELLDARVDDLDGGRHVLGGGQHLLHRHVGALQGCLEHEGQLHLHARRDEARRGDVEHLAGRAGEQHVVQQGAVVGLGDLAGLLHGARGQADLVADDGAAFGALEVHPGPADAVAVFDGHAGVAFGEVLHLHAAFFGLVQLGGELADEGVVKHGQIQRL
jgi:hypothetical protein